MDIVSRNLDDTARRSHWVYDDGLDHDHAKISRISNFYPYIKVNFTAQIISFWFSFLTGKANMPSRR